jgi:hypothetical protein
MPPPVHSLPSVGSSCGCPTHIPLRRMICSALCCFRSLSTNNNMLCSLLFHASMPTRYRVKALHTATYLLNHLSCKTISASCSYVALYSVAPSYKHLCIFGCVCYPNLSAEAAHKLSPPPGPLVVYSSDTPSITRAISVSISPPTTSSSPNMLFLMRQSFPSLSRPGCCTVALLHGSAHATARALIRRC